MGSEMNLFIPSKRMRLLLIDWLDDKGSSSTQQIIPKGSIIEKESEGGELF